jgi:hypothetical protein
VGRIGSKEGFSAYPFLDSRIVDTTNRRFLLAAHGVDYFGRLLCGLLLLPVTFEAEARLGGRRQTDVLIRMTLQVPAILRHRASSNNLGGRRQKDHLARSTSSSIDRPPLNGPDAMLVYGGIWHHRYEH